MADRRRTGSNHQRVGWLGDTRMSQLNHPDWGDPPMLAALIGQGHSWLFLAQTLATSSLARSGTGPGLVTSKYLLVGTGNPAGVSCAVQRKRPP